MPPKDKDRAEDTTQQLALQAVVFADLIDESTHYWGPLVDNDDEDVDGKPWCLVKFLDYPILSWTLQSLALGGVEDVLIFARRGHSFIKDYLSTFTPPSNLRINLRKTECLSPGDVLREIDSLNLLDIGREFLLVQAGYIGNVALSERCSMFAARRKKDPKLVMDALVRDSEGVSVKEVLSCFVTTPEGSLVHYSETPKYPKVKGLSGRLKVPKEILTDGKEVVMNTNLTDLGVWICTGEVPAQFTENFDWQTVFPDFIRGVLQSDILDLTMHCSTINSSSPSDATGEYASVLKGPKTWQAIREAMTGRWFYPLSLDNLVPEEGNILDLKPRKVFLSSTASIHSTARLGPSAIISTGTSVASSASIIRSSLSSNVSVGRRTSIENSFILANATIGDNVVIKNSIVSAGVVVAHGANVVNCILGDGVEVYEGTSVEDLWLGWDEDDGEGVEGVKGWIWGKPHDDDEDDDEEDEDWDKRMEIFYALGAKRADYAPSSVSSSSSISGRSRSSSSASESLSSGLSSSYDPPAIANIESLSLNAATDQKNQIFAVHCLESLRRAYDENLEPETTIIELKTLRLSSNVENSLVLRTVVTFLVERIEPSTVPQETAERASKVIEKWNPLILTWIEEPKKSGIEILLAMQAFCATHESHQSSFGRLIATFWQEDVLSKEAVLGWFTDERAKEGAGQGDEGKKAREAAARAVKMIYEAEADDEEEEENMDQPRVTPISKTVESSEEEESEEDSDEESESEQDEKQKPKVTSITQVDESGEEDSGEESEDEQGEVHKSKVTSITQVDESGEEDSGEESEDEQDEKQKPKVTSIVQVDESSEEKSEDEEQQPEAVTEKLQTTTEANEEEESEDDEEQPIAKGSKSQLEEEDEVHSTVVTKKVEPTEDSDRNEKDEEEGVLPVVVLENFGQHEKNLGKEQGNRSTVSIHRMEPDEDVSIPINEVDEVIGSSQPAAEELPSIVVAQTNSVEKEQQEVKSEAKKGEGELSTPTLHSTQFRTSLDDRQYQESTEPKTTTQESDSDASDLDSSEGVEESQKLGSKASMDEVTQHNSETIPLSSFSNDNKSNMPLCDQSRLPNFTSLPLPNSPEQPLESSANPPNSTVGSLQDDDSASEKVSDSENSDTDSVSADDGPPSLGGAEADRSSTSSAVDSQSESETEEEDEDDEAAASNRVATAQSMLGLRVASTNTLDAPSTPRPRQERLLNPLSAPDFAGPSITLTRPSTDYREIERDEEQDESSSSEEEDGEVLDTKTNKDALPGASHKNWDITSVTSSITEKSDIEEESESENNVGKEKGIDVRVAKKDDKAIDVQTSTSDQHSQSKTSATSNQQSEPQKYVQDRRKEIDNVTTTPTRRRDTITAASYRASLTSASSSGGESASSGDEDEDEEESEEED